MLRLREETALAKLKVKSDSREADEQKNELRKRNLMILILDFLKCNGYHTSSVQLEAEAGVNMKKFCVADNMDLTTILQEYESYYNIKFGKQPKITRRLTPAEVPFSQKKHSRVIRARGDSEATLFDSEADPLPKIKNKSSTPPPKQNSLATRNVTEKRTPVSIEKDSVIQDEVGIVGTSTMFKKQEKQQPTLQEVHDETLYDNKLLKPMPGHGNAEFRELAAIISRDIFMQNPNVRWSDIAGQDDSKRLIKEAVVFPMRYPDLFTGILTPWKGLLLYGPPGTGKTMLAKAIATECKTTFFNISASSIVSKWRGDSEKLVRVLFELARYHAPSTIFLDELEAIMSHRSGGDSGSEHEGSRRMKTELLIQLDGLAKTKDHVFLLAASNLPWELDVAMLRRLEKRILIGLPDEPARVAMFEKNLPSDMVDGYGVRAVSADPGLNYQRLGKLTSGYSGSDINLVCKEAAMRPLRRIFALLDASSDATESHDPSGELVLTRDPITQQDVEASISTTNPSCAAGISEKYETWSSQHGSE